jgi:hypothetical protein
MIEDKALLCSKFEIILLCCRYELVVFSVLIEGSQMRIFAGELLYNFQYAINRRAPSGTFDGFHKIWIFRVWIDLHQFLK